MEGLENTMEQWVSKYSDKGYILDFTVTDRIDDLTGLIKYRLVVEFEIPKVMRYTLVSAYRDTSKELYEPKVWLDAVELNYRNNVLKL